MRNVLWNQRMLGMRPGLTAGQGLAARRMGLTGRMGAAGQQGFAARRGLAGRGSAGTPSLLNVLEASRARLLQAQRDNVRELLNWGDAIAGRFGARGTAYGLQAVEGDTTSGTTTDTTTTTAAPTTTAQYAIDPTGLSTTVSTNGYTINGSVTGPAGGQSRIRVWLGDPSQPGRKLTDSNFNELLVSGNLVVDLPSGNNTFSLPIDLTKVPANVNAPPSASNPWLITASDTAGNDESDPPEPVPLPSLVPAPPIITTPTGPTTVNTPTAIVTGTLTASASSTIVHLWPASGSAKVAGAGAVAVTPVLPPNTTAFSITVTLNPGVANPLVATVLDLTTGLESSSTVVPTITQSATSGAVAPAPPTITSPTTATTVTTPTAIVTGTITASAASTMVHLWPASGNAKISGAGAVAATSALPANTTAFSITVTLNPGVANPMVATVVDLTSGLESTATVVPTITQSATTGTAAPAPPTITSPTTPTTVSTPTAIVTGTITSSASSTMVHLWPASGNAKVPGAGAVAGTSALPASTTAFSITVPLKAGAANPLVATVLDLTTGLESTATVVPTITQSTTTGAMPPAPPTITSPTTPATVSTSTAIVTGTLTASAANTMVHLWPASGNAKVAGAGAVAATASLPANTTAFSITVTLNPGVANPLVATVLDLSSGLESSPAVVPTITQSGSSPVITPPAPPSATSPIPYPGPVEDITAVEGITKSNANLLRAVGVHTTIDLLTMGATASKRRELAKDIADKTGKKVSAEQLREWVEAIDLMGLIGIGSKFADMLNRAGVDTVRELARRNAANLFEKLSEVNAEKHPSQTTLEKAIANAKAVTDLYQP